MLVPVSLPPGVLRTGTVEQSRARFFDCNLVRWAEGAVLTQMRGWAKRDPGQPALAGTARACLAWQDNGGDRWIAIGTNEKLFVQDADGNLSDITPAGFTPGLADATVGSGYGTGGFGTGTFGTERPDLGQLLPAAMWSLDLWNDRLVGCMAGDGKVYQWNLNPTVPAAAVSGADADREGLVVTDEGILMTFRNRTAKWSDQGDNTVWTPSDTNQARSLNLLTTGTILGARKAPGGVLVVTTTDAHFGTYQGFPLVYGFRRVGTACGMVSRGAMVSTGQRAAWMGRNGFFVYDGFVQPLACDIADLVYGDINAEQLSKVTSGHNAAAGEIWWNYCSAGSEEIDRQAIWNYRLNVWYPCRIARSCMADAGAFMTPVMVSPDGYVYAHETGFSYDDATPFAETGPLRLANGEVRMEVQRVVPDERNTGDLRLTFLARDYPDDPDTEHGPYVLSSPTDLLFQAGRVRVRYAFEASRAATVGDFMLELAPGDPLP